VFGSPEVVVDLCGSHSRRQFIHAPDGSQAQQEVVAGDQRQTHDLSCSSEKSVSRIAVRQWQLLSGQHDLMSLDRGLSEQIGWHNALDGIMPCRA